MKSFNYSLVSDPTFFEDNTLAPHSDAEYFAAWEQENITAHLTGDYLRSESVNQSTYFKENINGSWKLLTAPNYESLVKDWESPDFDCHGWDDIHVPAHLQMEGYCGVPHYTNVAYPWDGHENLTQPNIPQQNNPVAAYVKYFHVPERFLGERLFISFKGVESSLALFLNGQYIGYSEDTFTPSDFELTDYLSDGENKLCVLVTKWSSGSWLEDQDFFRFSGIFRDVFLYIKPEIHAEDIRVKTVISDNMTDAVLDITLDSNASGKATIELFDIACNCIVPLPYGINDIANAGSCDIEMSSKLSSTKKIKKGINSFTYTIDKISLWSAEHPVLYGLLITLENSEGICSEVIPMQIGFRRFELSDGLLKLNGKRIVFNGVNRHEFSSVSGRAVSFAETRHDLINMKRNNINAIRTCHYPDNSFVYALADNLGLYVIDETNMETHGTWCYGRLTPEQYANVVPGDNPAWEGAVLARVNNIYKRDKNHACVLIWSCGNESHGGINIYKMSERFRELDDTRLVQYEGICHDRRYNDTSDVESQMYTKVRDIEGFLKNNPDKPFICCEYSHAMGNSVGGIHKYVELTEREPRYQGGFIWDYIDQSITRKDRFGNEFEAYGGDFGDRPSDYNFSGDGIVYGGPDRESSPKMAEVKYVYSNINVLFNHDFTISIFNKNLFASTSEYSVNAVLLRDGVEIMSCPMKIAVAPMSTETYPLPDKITHILTQSQSSSESITERTVGEYSCFGNAEYAVLVKFKLSHSSLYAPANHEVAYRQNIYKCGSIAAASAADNSAESSITDKNADDLLRPYTISHGYNTGVKGDDFEILFDGSNGLCSYKKCGKELIDGFPRPTFWRAPTDNDRGNRFALRYSQWKLADMYLRVCEHHFTEENGLLKAHYTYMLPTIPETHCSVEYLVHANGTVDIEMRFDDIDKLSNTLSTYAGEKDCRNGALLPEMPLFGMLFRFKADYDNMKWYGYGPGESYIDRSHGNPIGIWNAKVSNQLSRYLVPQECANKIGVRKASVTDLKGRGVQFEAIPEVTQQNRYIDPSMSAELQNTFELQALNWTTSELEVALHSYELPAPHYTNVRIALAQLGISGDDSWGAFTHDEYRIDATKPLCLKFLFKGI